VRIAPRRSNAKKSSQTPTLRIDINQIQLDDSPTREAGVRGPQIFSPALLFVLTGVLQHICAGAPPRMSRGLRDAIIEALRGEIIAGRDLLEI
jgi:hypothetical protein